MKPVFFRPYLLQRTLVSLLVSIALTGCAQTTNTQQANKKEKAVCKHLIEQGLNCEDPALLAQGNDEDHEQYLEQLKPIDQRRSVINKDHQ